MHIIILCIATMIGGAVDADEKQASMHPTSDYERGRFTVGPGRGWADLLTPINFYRMNVRGFGLDVCVQAGTEVVPGRVIYPQIMATCALDGTQPRNPDGSYVYIDRPRNREGIYDGPPSLVVEIFARDEPWSELMTNSQILLAQGGVLEYVVWCPDGIQWFRLEADRYARIEPDDQGIIRSAALPGFWFNVVALTERDYARVFADIARGIKADLPEQYWAICCSP